VSGQRTENEIWHAGTMLLEKRKTKQLALSAVLRGLTKGRDKEKTRFAAITQDTPLGEKQKEGHKKN